MSLVLVFEHSHVDWFPDDDQASYRHPISMSATLEYVLMLHLSPCTNYKRSVDKYGVYLRMTPHYQKALFGAKGFNADLFRSLNPQPSNATCN